eukprot:TRINITY_DN58150_c0_g1_i1.p1 TRINITY_DN58150_c0_g1~~TRINITY_DN58150_c0_g1_i1.p1  ORF type:complete len:333 (+),score=13.34 TRINITY_DN58150_c0_g1_i1:26-1000(+)
MARRQASKYDLSEGRGGRVEVLLTIVRALNVKSGVPYVASWYMARYSGSTRPVSDICGMGTVEWQQSWKILCVPTAWERATLHVRLEERHPGNAAPVYGSTAELSFDVGSFLETGATEIMYTKDFNAPHEHLTMDFRLALPPPPDYAMESPHTVTSHGAHERERERTGARPRSEQSEHSAGACSRSSDSDLLRNASWRRGGTVHSSSTAPSRRTRYSSLGYSTSQPSSTTSPSPRHGIISATSVDDLETFSTSSGGSELVGSHNPGSSAPSSSQGVRSATRRHIEEERVSRTSSLEPQDDQVFRHLSTGTLPTPEEDTRCCVVM